MHPMIDLRSDTVTRPTPAIRQAMAEGITGLPGIAVDPSAVYTNRVYFDTARPAEEMLHKLETERVLALSAASHRIRLVTHCDVDAAAIEQAIAAIQRVCSSRAA